MDNILKLKLAKPKPKKALVKKITTKTVDALKDKPTKLIVHAIETNSNKPINLEEAWICRNGKKKVKSLWVNPKEGEIPNHSNLGLVMKYYDKESLEDFVDTEIEVFPDHNNYLVIAGCPVDDSVFKQELNKKDLY